MSEVITIEYKNWKGETRVRKILPQVIWYGSTEYHPERQWLVKALDIEDSGKIKDFALKDMTFID